MIKVNIHLHSAVCSTGGAGSHLPSTARLRDTTLVLIKPHAVLAGQAGKILNYLHSPGGFTVAAVALFNLDKANAEEFLQVYKGFPLFLWGISLILAITLILTLSDIGKNNF